MTIHRYLNKRQESGNAVLWWLIQALLDAGWTCPRSGSGTGGIFSTANVFGDWAKRADAVVGIGVGQEDWGKQNSWIVLEDPSGNRQILIDTSAQASAGYEGYWGIFYSPGGLYTGGDATTVPTATDELTVFGDHANGLTLFSAGDIPNMVHVAADDTPSPAGEYGFLVVNFTSVCITTGYLFLDDLRQAAAGDPAAVVLGGYSVGMPSNIIAGNYFRAQVDVGGAGEAWNQIGYGWPRVNGQDYQDIPAGASRYDGKERPLPIFALDPSIGGFLGASRWFRASPVGPIRHYNTQEGKTVFTVDDTVLVDFWDATSEPETI